MGHWIGCGDLPFNELSQSYPFTQADTRADLLHLTASDFTSLLVGLRSCHQVNFRVLGAIAGIFLSNRTFHSQKLRSNTINNSRGFYQIAFEFNQRNQITNFPYEKSRRHY